MDCLVIVVAALYSHCIFFIPSTRWRWAALDTGKERSGSGWPCRQIPLPIATAWHCSASRFILYRPLGCFLSLLIFFYPLETVALTARSGCGGAGACYIPRKRKVWRLFKVEGTALMVVSELMPFQKAEAVHFYPLHNNTIPLENRHATWCLQCTPSATNRGT